MEHRKVAALEKIAGELGWISLCLVILVLQNCGGMDVNLKTVPQNLKAVGVGS